MLVTHEREMADFADRIVTMRDGLIVSEERTTTALAAGGVSASGEPIALPAPESQAAQPGARESEAFARPRLERQAADAPPLHSLFRMAFEVAVRAIARNKLRSALTMLGIFIGVAALIAMVAIGQGANAAVAAQIDTLGANMLIVIPGATSAGGVHGAAAARRACASRMPRRS